MPSGNGSPESSGRYLIAGLGNPGPRYVGNRHNVGIRCVRGLADIHHLDLDRRRKRVLYGLGSIGNQRVIVAHALTYMNESGRAIAPLARFFRVPPRRLLVVYDDLDLALGTIRLRPSGGSGGHKGVRSIIHHLGGLSSFPRLRIGIDRPPGKMDPAAYVLQDFSDDDERVVADVLVRAVAAIELWLSEGLDAAMNAFN